MTGVLFVNIPERCSVCEFKKETNEGYTFCKRLGFDYHVNKYIRSLSNGKPDWCPIKQMPSKINTVIGCEYIDGWNDCIDCICE